MKTKLISLLALVIAFLAGGRAEAEIASGEGWTLSDEGVLTVNKDFEYSSADGYPWYSNKESIKRVVIAEGVTSIGEEAFNDYGGLKGVEMAESLKSIGREAFAFTGLSGELTMPGSLASIGPAAFIYCAGLTGKLTIPGGVTRIGVTAFTGCTGLTAVEIQYGVTEIAFRAFYLCRGLKEVEIPESVKSIGEEAFDGCSELKRVVSLSAEPQELTANVFPAQLLSGMTLYVQGEVIEAYKGAEVWKNFGNIEKYVETIVASGEGWRLNDKGVLTVNKDFEYSSGDGYPWYSNKESIKRVVIAKGVASIGKEAFIGFGGIEHVVIAEGVESIGVDAFYACSGLKSVEIPASVERIEESAFCNCSGLQSIEVAEGNAKYDSRGGCNAIIEKERSMLLAGCKNTVIPEDVTTIGEYAFTGCSEMASVTIPASVTGIGGFSFFGCSGLKEVTSLSVTPQELEEGRIWTFNEVEVSSATLYVPAEAVEEYKKAPVWNRFGTI
ncbi:MAG: leucine-rich repeat domain-containing protein, partial [Bacteroidales bacterium]|nr:leucine-rich repeat domain-containing protein [Bacteroidales bacterium]